MFIPDQRARIALRKGKLACKLKRVSPSCAARTKRVAFGEEAHRHFVETGISVAFWSTLLAPDFVGRAPALRLTEEVDNPVGIAELAGFDEDPSERDQLSVVGPPSSPGTRLTFARRHHHDDTRRLRAEIQISWSKFSSAAEKMAFTAPVWPWR